MLSDSWKAFNLKFGHIETRVRGKSIFQKLAHRRSHLQADQDMLYFDQFPKIAIISEAKKNGAGPYGDPSTYAFTLG